MNLHDIRQFATPVVSRRDFLRKSGAGFGMLALSGLIGQEAARAASPRELSPLAPQFGQHSAGAKRVIWLFMNGGQSHVDTWDYKPALAKYDGKELEGFDKNTGFFAQNVGGLMKSPFKFRQYGQSGTWASELFPSVAQHVDDMAFIHSCHTDSNNHSPALYQVNCGMPRLGLPCVGSWVTYGLGTENQNLPGFVVMYDTLGRGLPKGHSLNWSAGFLPGVYQGTVVDTKGDAPIDNLHRHQTMTDANQRAQLDLLADLNKQHARQNEGEAALAARIESFELAYRMQMSAPEAVDLNAESEATREMYGLNNPKCAHFAKQVLTARRLVERGVRFVQIYSGGMENQRSWDGHSDIQGNHQGFAGEVDQPIGALLTDLKRRGMLEDTLVICAGEFGRLPLAQTGDKPGRDHNPHAFTTWFAGGGVKGGTHYGETDEIGHKATVNKVHIHDLHATVLHLMGIEHTKLTYTYNGRRYRLTDVYGNVVHDVIA